MNILVTGATGNVGKYVTSYLSELIEMKGLVHNIIIADRNIDKATKFFEERGNLTYRRFDFDDNDTFDNSLQNIDLVFLLRPPQISEIDKYFRPLFEGIKRNGIKKIVFLSVQGADKSKVIPHNKIELLIKEYNFQYIFVRPSYFMQNLTTALLEEIRNNSTITLPSSKAKFNWIDAKNIGLCIAELILSFENYKNKAITITGEENLNFITVSNLLSDKLGKEIEYNSVNPLKFYFIKRKQGISSGFAIVMTILHFLPRFQKEPEITNSYYEITGESPTKLIDFISREKQLFN